MSWTRVLTTCAVAALVATVVDVPEPTARHGTPGSGARGYKHVYYGGAIRNKRFTVTPAATGTGVWCHVEWMTDPSVAGGPASADGKIGSTWVPLRPCMDVTNILIDVDRGTAVRVRDPMITLADEDTIDACNCELPETSQVWVIGPPEPGFVPMARVASPVAVAKTGADDGNFVMDHEAGGVTRITNAPWSTDSIMVEAPFDTIPVWPGESVRVMPDGTFGAPGTVLVAPPEPVYSSAGTMAHLIFDVHNLGLTPADYALEVDQVSGWGVSMPPPIITVPALSSKQIVIDVDVSPLAMENYEGVYLKATDTTDPDQFHWGMSNVIVVPDAVPTTSEWGLFVALLLLIVAGALVMRRRGWMPRTAH